MERSVYEVESEIEDRHWWFAGRRRLLDRELDAAAADPRWRALDMGSGTGGNLRLLRGKSFSVLFGIDASFTAAKLCTGKGFAPVALGDAAKLPFVDGSFDLVLAMDVLEHVEDDRMAAKEISRILRPGGLAIVTVPAFASLWGPQDDLSHHLRRYRMKPLLAILSAAGLQPKKYYHFNYILFLPIFFARRILRLLKVKLRSENEVNSPAINVLLRRLFNFDVDWAPKLRLPFGVSICVVLRKGEA